MATFPYAGSYNSTSGYVDELGPGCMFDTPSGVAVLPNSGGAVAYVADTGNHAVRRVNRELPSQLHIRLLAFDPKMFSDTGFKAAYNLKDTGLDNYGYYSVNGPPNNETTHAHGTLSYAEESHHVIMCAYASSEYFFHFRGSLQVEVYEDHSDKHHGNVNRTYVAWTGYSAEDERAENVVLSGGGMVLLSQPISNSFS